MASFLQPAATSIPLGATLSAQIIPNSIKPQPQPVYKGERLPYYTLSAERLEKYKLKEIIK